MKKNRFLLISILIMALVLIGCKKKDEMVSFIPTLTPSVEDNNEDPDDTSIGTGDEAVEDVEKGTQDETTDRPIHVGKTITKYVKMSSYDATLNVRSEPSTDAAKVGFLVHAEKIDVISIENGWACFVMNNELRYVSIDFLVDKRPAYIDPPTLAPTLPPTNAPTQTPDLTNPPEI